MLANGNVFAFEVLDKIASLVEKESKNQGEQGQYKGK